MEKKNIIFCAIAFAAGVVTGTTGTIIVKHVQGKKEKKPARTAPLLKKDLKKNETPETPVQETKEEPASEAQVLARENEIAQEIIHDEGYAAENEHPEDDDPDEEKYRTLLKAKEQRETYVNAHKGKIEMMREEEWDTDFPEEDYSHQELWYFPDEDVLTDEDGNLVEPIVDYVGNIFDKTNFKNNDWERIYIRNHPKEEDYYIHKETTMSREDFFY